MAYDEGVRQALFSTVDTMGITVQSFAHFDVQLHQECFWASQQQPQQQQQQQESRPSNKGKRRLATSDLSTRVRSSPSGTNVCFKYNLGRCILPGFHGIEFRTSEQRTRKLPNTN
eukprot:COSAG02_NODE_2495_length_8684_cov_12.735469_2_plen_115_part_00